MDSIITVDQEKSLRSNTIHEHGNPFDVSLFEDNAKIKRIPLFALTKMIMELETKLSLITIQAYIMKAWVKYYKADLLQIPIN